MFDSSLIGLATYEKEHMASNLYITVHHMIVLIYNAAYLVIDQLRDVSLKPTCGKVIAIMLPHARNCNNLGNLFRIYLNPAFDDRMRATIHGSLEKRWAAADQNVVILAAFFNPYIRHQPFSKHALSHADINEMASRVCRRVLRKEPDLDFTLAFTSYYNDEDRYSKQWTHLDMMKSKFENEVC